MGGNVEHVVDKPKLGVEQPSPDHGDGGGRRDHGQEEDRAVHRFAHHIPIKQNGKHKSDDDGKWDFYDHIFKRIQRGLPNLRI
jgi:hypothetical protein